MLSDIFQYPQYYRNKFLSRKLIEGSILDNLKGKSFICVSLTRFCPVGCKFCFFKSGPVFKKVSLEDKMIPEGVEKFIKFANGVNLGYLLVSGGGEPMLEKQSVLRIIEGVDSERIVLVTSANWAKNYNSAKRYLNLINQAMNKRKTKTSVTVRVSVDIEHCATITLDPILNLIKLFSQDDLSSDSLDLQIHSVENDKSIDDLVSILKNNYNKVNKYSVKHGRISDGKSVIKIVPRQDILEVDNLKIPVGYAKIFFSDLKVDLTNELVTSRNINIYQNDLIQSEDGNSSVVTNKIGQPGLDFWVNYNGNVTTWGNQYLDNLFNIYVDSVEDVISKTLSDPAALSFIEKGAAYRDRIVAEANQIAVIRSKSVNIRDYTGALMFDEARTRLYYTIRALQDYTEEGRIGVEKIQNLPLALRSILGISKDKLVEAYNASEYTIIEQTMEKGFHKEYVLDVLTWIKLGHYSLSNAKKSQLLDFYNRHASACIGYQNLEGAEDYNEKMQIVRMTEHLTHIKQGVLVNE